MNPEAPVKSTRVIFGLMDGEEEGVWMWGGSGDWEGGSRSLSTRTLSSPDGLDG